jgi:PilZ domain-containing protein
MVPAPVLASWMSARRAAGAAQVGLARFLTPTLVRAAGERLSGNRRGEIRRSVYLGCRVRRMTGRGLVGDRSLDLSPQGMFVLSDEHLEAGTELFVSFQATDLPIWFDTRATVARLVAGRRLGDDGRGFGLRFRTLPAVSRIILRGHLRKAPRAAPQRWPVARPNKKDPDYAQLVRDIWEGRA